MPREKHKDFYARLVQTEGAYHKALNAELTALNELLEAPPGPKKDSLLTEYRRAINATHRTRERRQRFLDKYRP